MENKLEELTRKLYDEGLEQGRAEADKLTEDARTKAAQTVAQAEEKAAHIVADAQRKAEDMKRNTATEMQLASRQAMAQLKEQMHGMIVAKTVSPAIHQAGIDPSFIKEMLLTVAKNWNGNSGEKVELEALLPATVKEQFGKSFESSIKELLNNGIEVGYSAKVKSGFKIGAKNGGYYIDFSDQDFEALVGEFLKEKMSRILYGQQ